MVGVKKSLHGAKRPLEQRFGFAAFPAFGPEQRFAAHQPRIVLQELTSNADFLFRFLQASGVEQHRWQKSISPQVGWIDSQGTGLKFLSFGKVTAVLRCVSDEDKNERIVGVSGQGFEQTLFGFGQETQMRKYKTAPELGRVTALIEMQGLIERAERLAILKAPSRSPEHAAASAIDFRIVAVQP
jgi:hypothetical protein